MLVEAVFHQTWKKKCSFFYLPPTLRCPQLWRPRTQNNATLLLILTSHKTQLWVLTGTAELLENSPFAAWTAYGFWYKLVSFSQKMFWVKEDVWTLTCRLLYLPYKCHVLFDRSHPITIICIIFIFLFVVFVLFLWFILILYIFIVFLIWRGMCVCTHMCEGKEKHRFRLDH